MVRVKIDFKKLNNELSKKEEKTSPVNAVSSVNTKSFMESLSHIIDSPTTELSYDYYQKLMVFISENQRELESKLELYCSLNKLSNMLNSCTCKLEESIIPMVIM